MLYICSNGMNTVDLTYSLYSESHSPSLMSEIWLHWLRQGRKSHLNQCSFFCIKKPDTITTVCRFFVCLFCLNNVSRKRTFVCCTVLCAHVATIPCSNKSINQQRAKHNIFLRLNLLLAKKQKCIQQTNQVL